MELQWPLILFTLFVTLGAGAMGAVGICSILGKHSKTALPGLVVSFASLVIGGLCSVAHLQTPQHYFNQLGNIASGINQEVIALGLCVILIIASFVKLRREGEGGAIGKVLGALDVAFAVILVLVMSHSYLMPAIPAWNTLLLPLFYVANAAAFGTFVQVALCGVYAPEENLKKLSLIALCAMALVAVVTIAYVIYLNCADYAPRVWWDGAAGPADANGSATALPMQSSAIVVAQMLGGSLAGAFWGGVVVAGIAAPAAFGFASWHLESGRKAAYAALGAVVLFAIGMIAFRGLLYVSALGYFAY